jgi:hypothetical protein
MSTGTDGQNEEQPAQRRARDAPVVTVTNAVIERRRFAGTITGEPE